MTPGHHEETAPGPLSPPLSQRLRLHWEALRADIEPAVALPLGMGLAALAVPTGLRLAEWVWPTDDQGHGPLILAISTALFLRAWPRVQEAGRSGVAPSAGGMAWALLALALPVYALGRSQAVLMMEVGALVVLAAALLLMHHGWGGLKAAGFAMFFLLFMIPLPEALVAAVTAPLKSAVSWVAASVLQAASMPVARTGVMLTAGPYQLLVADACAGLNTLFTLEALGMLYLHLAGHTAWWRNIALATMLVPIAFAANVMRVITLVLITLFFGDAAGRGYAHDFAGMTLFVVGLGLMLLADGGLGLAARWMRIGHGAGADGERAGEVG